jgi:hypothetical protein
VDAVLDTPTCNGHTTVTYSTYATILTTVSMVITITITIAIIITTPPPPPTRSSSLPSAFAASRCYPRRSCGHPQGAAPRCVICIRILIRHFCLICPHPMSLPLYATVTAVSQSCGVVDERRTAHGVAITITITRIILRAVTVMDHARRRCSPHDPARRLPVHPQRHSRAHSHRLLPHRVQNVAKSPLAAAVEGGDFLCAQVCRARAACCGPAAAAQRSAKPQFPLYVK